uniref:Uncharacterized protein n=1 Tax=Anopheles minimus TaxID=112268 RepID=A0A182WPX8_9DIPT
MFRFFFSFYIPCGKQRLHETILIYYVYLPRTGLDSPRAYILGTVLYHSKPWTETDIDELYCSRDSALQKKMWQTLLRNPTLLSLSMVNVLVKSNP